MSIAEKDSFEIKKSDNIEVELDAELVFTVEEVLQITTMLTNSYVLSLTEKEQNNVIAPKLIKKIIRISSDKTLRLYISKLRNLEISVMETLSQDEHVEVRESIASRSGAKGYYSVSQPSITALEALSRDESETVRKITAESLGLNEEILQILAADLSSVVRAVVAGRTQLTDNIIAQLARDKSTKVLEALAKNKGLEEKHMLQILDTIGIGTSKSLTQLESLSRIADSLAAHSRTPTSILERIRRYAYSFIVARHSNATPEMLHSLYSIEKSNNTGIHDGRTIVNITRNNNTPSDLLKKIYEDIKMKVVKPQDIISEIQKNIAIHPNTPKNIRNEIEKKKELWSTPLKRGPTLKEPEDFMWGPQ